MVKLNFLPMGLEPERIGAPSISLTIATRDRPRILKS